MVFFNAIHIAMCLSIYYIFGMRSLLFFFAYSIAAMFWVEWINYCEHYGLQRTKDKNGIYESITI